MNHFKASESINQQSLITNKKMTITQLEYVVAVDTHKGFGQAAKNCFVTQPTLSMQIKKLEEELGVILFDRSKKPVLTTDIGMKIIEQAKSTIREAKRVQEIIENEKGDFSGTLRIGIIPTISPYLIPRFAPNFVRKYPKVKMKIEELLSSEIIKKLQNDQLDVGIMIGREGLQGLVKIPLFYEQFLLYFSKNHALLQNEAVDLQQLNPNEIWLLKEGHCFRDQIENFCGDTFFKNKTKSLEFESGSVETLRRIVENEVGYTLLPELAVEELGDKKAKFVRAFRGVKPTREVSFIIHRSYLKENLIHALKKAILAAIPTEMLDEKRGKIVEWVR
jgi:LysR family hydrogen peroxide-inducible transcriptional activator